MAKTREEQLLATEELNRRILEAMPGGIVHVAPDGAIVSANAEALRILGLGYDALTKRYITDFDTETLSEDGTPCPASEYPVAKALATGRAQPPTTIGVRRRDGHTSWAVFTAVPLLSSQEKVEGAIVTFLDITEWKKSEAALRESEGTLRSILESANPIAIADRDGILLFSNRFGPGVDPKDVIGKPAWAALHPDDREKARRAVAEVVATGESRSYETRGLTSGRVYVVHALPRYVGGEVVGVTFVSWDITAQRELEARLTVADRMASIGTLAAGVAHEINNPLTYVLASLERLERSLRRGEREEDTCAMIAAALEGARRIRSIVSDLSTFSHVGEGRKVLLDVRQMLDSSIRMAENEIRFRARVVRDYADVPPLLASDSRIGQVFLNLLVNAAQAIPEGNVDTNEIRVVTRMDESGRVVVEVSDTGVGVPADMIDKIFDPFVTTKPRGVGTGLGLYICRNIVRSLGGEIGVENRASRGSTFRVTLPAARPSDRPPTPRDAWQPGALPRRLRVLVVDDEPAILSVMKAFLSEHDVTVARDGREAIELIDTNDLDLVFCDLIMPNLTGMDVYEHVRTRKPGSESRMVFMTGGAFTDRARAFLENAKNPVLEKPFTQRDVEAVLAERASPR